MGCTQSSVRSIETWAAQGEANWHRCPLLRLRRALVQRDDIDLEVSPLPACLFNQQIAQFDFLPKLSYREVHSREQLPLERRSVHESRATITPMVRRKLWPAHAEPTAAGRIRCRQNAGKRHDQKDHQERIQVSNLGGARELKPPHHSQNQSRQRRRETKVF